MNRTRHAFRWIPARTIVAASLLALLESAAPVQAGDPPAQAGTEAQAVRFEPRIGLDGRPVDLNAPTDGVSVLVFLSAECPISNAYSPTLNELAGAFAGGTFRMAGVYVDPDLSDAEVATHAREFALKFPTLRDPRSALAARLGAKVTPEAFVLDARGRICYHGRIDDQFAARRKRNANTSTHELRDAAEAVLAGVPVAAPYVEAVGCPIPDPTPAGPTPK